MTNFKLKVSRTNLLNKCFSLRFRFSSCSYREKSLGKLPIHHKNCVLVFFLREKADRSLKFSRWIILIETFLQHVTYQIAPQQRRFIDTWVSFYRRERNDIIGFHWCSNEKEKTLNFDVSLWIKSKNLKWWFVLLVYLWNGSRGNSTVNKISKKRNRIVTNSFSFRHVLRVSIWNDVLTGSNRTVGEVDVVLADIDWSKENICDYTLKLS